MAFDFTHYKIYGRSEDSVEQYGTWHGASLHEVAPMRERVQSFEITHGLNMRGLSVLQRLSASRHGVYVGGGPVIYVPHSETRVDGLPGGDRFNFGGFGGTSALAVIEAGPGPVIESPPPEGEDSKSRSDDLRVVRGPEVAL